MLGYVATVEMSFAILLAAKIPKDLFSGNWDCNFPFKPSYNGKYKATCAKPR